MICASTSVCKYSFKVNFSGLWETARGWKLFSFHKYNDLCKFFPFRIVWFAHFADQKGIVYYFHSKICKEKFIFQNVVNQTEIFLQNPHFRNILCHLLTMMTACITFSTSVNRNQFKAYYLIFILLVIREDVKNIQRGVYIFLGGCRPFSRILGEVYMKLNQWGECPYFSSNIA